MVGPRKGYPHTPMTPHDMTMCLTGTGMLSVGWFGFNGGNALAASADAAMAILVTQLKTQSLEAVITIAWTLVGTYLSLAVASIAGLRVHPDDEEIGLDLTQHTERGYDL
jgi:Amt family ammonium transporter